MMMRFPGFALILAATLAAPSFAQDRALDSGGVPPAAANAIDGERPMSVFNDKVRRFRFVLEGTLVTAETAEEFMITYQGRNQPEIIGAYADAETNALVVVGPPDAEHAIRVTLAARIVERQDAGARSLELQKRALQLRRQELLFAMADTEVASVDAEPNKAAQLQARLEAFESELNVLQRKLQIVDRYLQKLRDPPSDAPQATVAR
jgi:hypothetical protein